MLENCDEMDDFNSVLHNQTVATKIRDLHSGGSGQERDMLKFFSKRISCSCLKERHSVARRTLPKLGKCSHCKMVKARTLLMVCGSCKVHQYCSEECQIARWHQSHQRHCREYFNAATNKRYQWMLTDALTSFVLLLSYCWSEGCVDSRSP